MKIKSLTFTLLFCTMLWGTLAAQKCFIISQSATEKVLCGPCDDYYGHGGGPSISVVHHPGPTPGSWTFFQIPDPNPQTSYIGGEWSTLALGGFNVGLNDSVTMQFTQNGDYDVQFVGTYQIPGAQCAAYRWVQITISDLPQVVTAAAPPTLDTPSETIAAYPNPVQGTLYVDWASPNADKGRISLINASGQLVLEGLKTTRGKLEIDMNDLPVGLYFLKGEVGTSEQCLPIMRR